MKWAVVAALVIFGAFYLRTRLLGRKAHTQSGDKLFKDEKRAADRLVNLDSDLKEIEEELSGQIEENELLFAKKSAPPLRLVEPSEFLSLEEALRNTKKGLLGRLVEALGGDERNTAADLEKIEEALYTSDLGPNTVQRLLDGLSKKFSGAVQVSSHPAANQRNNQVEAVCSFLRSEMLEILEASRKGLSPLNRHFKDEKPLKPQIWIIVGVNGAGKTTTIGKLSYQLAKSGKRVLVAAGDTFRAAAEEQLKAWTERAQVEIYAPVGVESPSAVAFDAVKAGVTRKFDYVLIDTAGRLHTQKNLMEELKKVKRVVSKAYAEALSGLVGETVGGVEDSIPQEVLLILDANSGQNALIQAKEFNDTLKVTGVVLTKLDGTAKGGVAIGLASEIGLSVQLIGVGERKEDLRAFEPKAFVEAII